MVLGWGGQARGTVAVANTVKASAAATVAALRGLGLRTVLLTGTAAMARSRSDSGAVGDRRGAARRGDAVMRALTARALAGAAGSPTALAAGGLGMGAGGGGMAVGAGRDCAASVLGVIPTMALARATLATIRRNLAWAFGYNIAAIPLAAPGCSNPLPAKGGEASSAFVVASSIRLRRFGEAAPSSTGPAGPAPGPTAAGGTEPHEKPVMPGMNSRK